MRPPLWEPMFGSREGRNLLVLCDHRRPDSPLPYCPSLFPRPDLPSRLQECLNQLRTHVRNHKSESEEISPVYSKRPIFANSANPQLRKTNRATTAICHAIHEPGHHPAIGQTTHTPVYGSTARHQPAITGLSQTVMSEQIWVTTPALPTDARSPQSRQLPPASARSSPTPTA